MRRIRFWLLGIVGFITIFIGEGLLRRFLATSLCGILTLNSGFCNSYFFENNRATAQSLNPEQVAATEIVETFRQETVKSPWNVQDGRAQVANRLKELIVKPYLLNHGFLNLCGPATFFYIWFKGHPDAATKFVTELYDKGDSEIGTLRVSAHRSILLNFEDYQSIIKDRDGVMPFADWMMLSTLRNSENPYRPYTGNPDSWFNESKGGGTYLEEVKKWLQFAKLYDDIDIDRNGIAEKDQPPNSEQDVIVISINPNLISPGYTEDSSHLIVPTTKIAKEGNNIIFHYWTWGSVNTGGKDDYPTVFDKKTFQSMYHGALIVNYQKCKSKDKQNSKECKLKEGGSNNDPHLTTFDGLKYDLQTVGEFTLIKSNYGDFEIQARQTPWNNSASVSINSAVAMKVGSDRVAIYAQGLPDADTSTPLRVNGKPTTIQGDKLTLQGGGEILRQGSTYVVSAPTGEKVLVSSSGSFLNISPYAYKQSGRYSGLLGNVNGSPNDDLQVRGGSNVLEVRSTYGDVKKVLNLVGLRAPGALDRAEQVYFDQLYKQFANSWRVKQEESLFDYSPGKTTQSYVNPGFPDKYLTLNMLSADQIQKAQNACTEAKVTPDLMEGCIFDVGFSGFSEFARTTAEINSYVGIVNQLFPSLKIPTPEQAVDRVIERVKPRCLPFIGCH